MKQTNLLKKESKAYGGELLKTRKGRASPRPLDTRNTMHLVLRSAKARGEWSFKKPKNEAMIRQITNRFSQKFGVKILSLANVGNHLHFQIKLSNRFTYRPFIRALTASIAMAVTGASRWSPLKEKFIENGEVPSDKKLSFWDYRPFTRVVQGFKAFLNLRDYIEVNQLEGLGCRRVEARYILATSVRRTAVNSS
jgi:hypothetical protein